jgi:hypothetical protein
MESFRRWAVREAARAIESCNRMRRPCGEDGDAIGKDGGDEGCWMLLRESDRSPPGTVRLALVRGKTLGDDDEDAVVVGKT